MHQLAFPLTPAVELNMAVRSSLLQLRASGRRETQRIAFCTELYRKAVRARVYHYVTAVDVWFFFLSMNNDAGSFWTEQTRLLIY